MARPYGITPRNEWEKAAWKALRGQIFIEASEIFLRLLRGDTVNSNTVTKDSTNQRQFPK